MIEENKKFFKKDLTKYKKYDIMHIIPKGKFIKKGRYN